MDPLRALAYAGHVVAALALTAAASRAPSLRRPAAVVALGLPLSVLVGAFTRADGRVLYHASQGAQFAWLALVLVVAGASLRAALALWGVAVVAALAWWPRPASPLYAVAQALVVGLAVAALVREYRTARAPLPGHLVAIILVAAELSVLVAPFGLAAVLGEPVAAEWDSARVVRLVEWIALAVVGWRTWRSAQSWPSWDASSPSWRGEDGSRARRPGSLGRWWRRCGEPGSGESGSDGSAPSERG